MPVFSVKKKVVVCGGRFCERSSECSFEQTVDVPFLCAFLSSWSFLSKQSVGVPFLSKRKRGFAHRERARHIVSQIAEETGGQMPEHVLSEVMSLVTLILQRVAAAFETEEATDVIERSATLKC